MDKELANTIPISEILGKLDLQPVRVEDHMLSYWSPWDRKRRTSLTVDTQTNRWSDPNTQDGTLVEWVVQYLQFGNEAHTERDALRWITNMSGNSSGLTIAQVAEQPRIELRHKKTIQYPGLLHYLDREGISLHLAQKYLNEIHARNRQTGKDFIALGMPTVEGGYALRTAYLERYVGQLAISFIRGRKPKPPGIHLFKEALDFLSVLSHLNRMGLDGDVIILNDWGCLPQVPAYLHQYGYQTMYTWLDNTQQGDRATALVDQSLQSEAGTFHQPMNKLYAAHPSVHAWHRHTAHQTA